MPQSAIMRMKYAMKRAMSLPNKAIDSVIEKMKKVDEHKRDRNREMMIKNGLLK